MPAWIGKRLAPLEATRVFSLKGSTALKPASLSCDLAHIEVQFSQDFVFPLRRVPVHAYDVTLDAAPVPSVFDVRIPRATVVESSLPLVAQISENLLTLIAPGVVSGKDYRSQRSSKETQRRLFEGTERRDRRESIYRKAYRERSDGTGTTRYRLTIWDLLFPLLKPPLNLDSASTLDLPSDLYPFQVKGVKELVRHESFLLADEMGTGKTVITSVALRILFHEGKVRRALIVCPKSVLGVWDTHLRDWASTLSVTVVAGRRVDRWIDWHYPSHVYVVAYDSLRVDATTRKQEVAPLMQLASSDLSFDAVVLDEAHAVKNPSARRTRAVR